MLCPISMALTSTALNTATTISRTPVAIVPDRIPDRIASRDREQRQDQAQQRGRIFTEDHPQLCLTIEQPKGCM